MWRSKTAPCRKAAFPAEKTKSEEKLRKLCSSIMQFVNYDDTCLTKCLNLTKDLGETGFNNYDCGFSDRLGNIVQNIMMT